MMNCRRLILGDPPRPRGLWISIFAIIISFIGAASLNAQDIAEAARQEKARKSTQQSPKRKVYSNEDLKKPQILTPEDHMRAEAAKRVPVTDPSRPPDESDDAKNDATNDVTRQSAWESLGEIARRYRYEAEAHRAVQAEKLEKVPSPSRYKMDLPKFPLTAPLSPRATLAPPSSPRPEFEKPGAYPALARRDPFLRASSITPSHGSISPVAPANVAPGKSTDLVISAGRRSERTFISNAPKTVTVKPGDSLWKLAKRYFGCGSCWNKLLDANPGLPDPRHIRPGTALVIQVAAPGIPAKSPASILVQKGDTLWKIAAVQFGRGSYWTCLARANPQLRDINQVEPGQALRIPATCLQDR
jgi:nucleoid-associated protein YgaU